MSNPRVWNRAFSTLRRMAIAAVLLAAGIQPGFARSDPPQDKASLAGGSQPAPAPVPAPAAERQAAKPAPTTAFSLTPDRLIQSAQTVGLFALISLAPAAVLMLTSFVRINMVLILLRQALGSPQVPGNQVITALALLLTALVMRPVCDVAYSKAIKPYVAGQLTPLEAWQTASRPVKVFMLRQIERTSHEDYLWQLYDYAVPPAPGRTEPTYAEEFPFRVVAPAFLLSELTTALVIGFYIYLPFLIIDLVVSAVLAAMGLFMLPPALVSMPLKLILFVLADGWLLVATMLLQGFAVS